MLGVGYFIGVVKGLVVELVLVCLFCLYISDKNKIIAHMLKRFATSNILKPLPLFIQPKLSFSSITPATTPPLSIKTTHTITQPLIHQFSAITGDTNPIHINKQFAQKSIFRQQISHGMLPMGWLGEILNQNGYQVKTMEIKFMKPIYIGDRVIVEVSVHEGDGKVNGGDDIKCQQFNAEIRKQYMQRNDQQSKQDKSQQHIIVTSITGSVQLLTTN